MSQSFPRNVKHLKISCVQKYLCRNVELSKTENAATLKWLFKNEFLHSFLISHCRERIVARGRNWNVKTNMLSPVRIEKMVIKDLLGDVRGYPSGNVMRYSNIYSTSVLIFDTKRCWLEFVLFYIFFLRTSWKQQPFLSHLYPTLCVQFYQIWEFRFPQRLVRLWATQSVI